MAVCLNAGTDIDSIRCQCPDGVFGIVDGQAAGQKVGAADFFQQMPFERRAGSAVAGIEKYIVGAAFVGGFDILFCIDAEGLNERLIGKAS